MPLTLHSQPKTSNIFLENIAEILRVTSWSFLSSHAQRAHRCESAPRDTWNGPEKSSRKVTEGPVGTRSEPRPAVPPWRRPCGSRPCRPPPPPPPHHRPPVPAAPTPPPP